MIMTNNDFWINLHYMIMSHLKYVVYCRLFLLWVIGWTRTCYCFYAGHVHPLTVAVWFHNLDNFIIFIIIYKHILGQSFSQITVNQVPHTKQGPFAFPRAFNSSAQLVTQPWARPTIVISKSWEKQKMGLFIKFGEHFSSVSHQQLESDLSVRQSSLAPTERMKEFPCMKLLLLYCCGVVRKKGSRFDKKPS